jgi:hypothetical protein
MLLEVEMPMEPFNSMIKAGTVGQKIQEVLGAIKPEAVYFTNRGGHRGAILIVDVPDASAVPALAEPFYLVFNASAQFSVCMTPEDLGKSNLDELGRKYA